MPGPVSQSHKGPSDKRRFAPRWAYPHLSDADYERLKRLHENPRIEPSPRAAPKVSR